MKWLIESTPRGSDETSGLGSKEETDDETMSRLVLLLEKGFSTGETRCHILSSAGDGNTVTVFKNEDLE